METIQKIEKCYRYRDLETSIFLSSFYFPQYTLLTGILLYENGEYTRAIKILSRLNTFTSVFYEVLCLKKLKRYALAMERLLIIYSSNCSVDISPFQFMERFIVNCDDVEYFDDLAASLSVHMGNIDGAIQKSRKSFFKSPLLNSTEILFGEKVIIEPINDLALDIVYQYYRDLLSLYSFDSSVDQKLVLKYSENTSGIWMYFISKMASFKIRYNSEDTGLDMFSQLRQKDSSFIREMDAYSSGLWKSKKTNILGLLARELSESHPNHFQTWIVIGNYYSAKNKSSMSIKSLLRSNEILENPHTYTLLGFEFSLKSHYRQAMAFFQTSIKMSKNNDKAYLGLALISTEIQRYTDAESNFLKALQLNPYNMSIKAHLIRFYVRNKELETALKYFKTFMGMEYGLHKVVECVIKQSGGFSELQDLMIIEFSEILYSLGLKSDAMKILSCVESRTSSYFAKKCLIEQ